MKSFTIVCSRLSKSFQGRFVLQDVSFEVAAQSSLGILGASGSGKTTILRLLAGLTTPDEGEIILAGRLVSTAGRLLVPPHKRGLAMVFQDLALWPNLTVAVNVGLALANERLSRQEKRRRVTESLEICGIAELASRLPGTLSGGQQQRVALARALATSPKVLLLDEPFVALDLITKDEIFREILRVQRELGLLILLVSHEPADLLPLCESALVLEAGRVAESGRLSELLAAPRSVLLSTFVRRYGCLGRQQF